MKRSIYCAFEIAQYRRLLHEYKPVGRCPSGRDSCSIRDMCSLHVILSRPETQGNLQCSSVKDTVPAVHTNHVCRSHSPLFHRRSFNPSIFQPVLAKLYTSARHRPASLLLPWVGSHHNWQLVKAVRRAREHTPHVESFTCIRAGLDSTPLPPPSRAFAPEEGAGGEGTYWEEEGVVACLADVGIVACDLAAGRGGAGCAEGVEEAAPAAFSAAAALMARAESRPGEGSSSCW